MGNRNKGTLIGWWGQTQRERVEEEDMQMRAGLLLQEEQTHGAQTEREWRVVFVVAFKAE